MGADLVTISVLDPDYPPELLKAQSEAVGVNTGSGSRGVHVFQLGVEPKDWKSTFAVDGLIDRTKGLLHLQPIARALAGAPAPHTVRQFQVDFDFEPPKPTYPGDFISPAVQVRRSTVAPSLTYDITLVDQDASHIVIPDSNVLPKPTVVVQRTPVHTDWVTFAAFGLGALAVGALVYSLLLVLLRPGTKKRPQT